MGDLRICKKCDLQLKMSAETSEYIMEYVERLPQSKRRNQESYQRCLEICDCCDKLFDGICNACGCYVAIRASVRGSHCPYEKW